MKLVTQSWDGWFSVQIPADWVVGGDEGVIAIRPGRDEGVLQFSFLRRSNPSEPTRQEAEQIMDLFAKNAGLRMIGSFGHRAGKGEVRVAGSYEPSTTSDGMPGKWELCCVLWNDRAVRGSWAHEDASGNTASKAREVFETIEKA